MLYLTRPVTLHPLPESIGRDDRFDFFAAHVDEAYHFLHGGAIRLPALRDGLVDIETYAAAALRLALVGHRDVTPSMLFDCRLFPATDSPSASYKLAAKAGLRMTPPIMLTGQGGVEVLQAMQFFAASAKRGHGMLVSSSTMHAIPKEKTSTPAFACAGLLSKQSFGEAEIHVHGVALARGVCAEPTRIDQLVKGVMRESGLTGLTWIALLPADRYECVCVDVLPNVARLQWADALGRGPTHTDALLALGDHAHAIPEGEPGALICFGSSNLIGVAVLTMH